MITFANSVDLQNVSPIFEKVHFEKKSADDNNSMKITEHAKSCLDISKFTLSSFLQGEEKCALFNVH